jgi:hypothetical protein
MRICQSCQEYSEDAKTLHWLMFVAENNAHVVLAECLSLCISVSMCLYKVSITGL